MNILKQFIRVASPFWLNKSQWFTWAILAVCITINLLMVKVYVHLNTWNKSFFDALSELDGPLIYDLLFEFALIVAVIVTMKVYAKWLQQWVEIRWRTWITENLIDRWMNNKHYYHLTLTKEPDNPDQRIAEDAKILTTDTIGLLLGFIKSVATLLAFSVVLWEVSEGFALPLFDDFTLSGYLFWLALLYSIIGSGVTHFFGHQLHGLYYQQQKKEATFRAGLLRKRDNAEQIAFMHGENTERKQLENDFSAIAGNWKSVMGREKKLGFIVNSYHQIAAMVPYFAALPSLMVQAITIGGLFQVKMAFMKVYGSFSWFVFRYDDLNRLSATVSRLGQFLEALDNCEQVLSKDEQVLAQSEQKNTQKVYFGNTKVTNLTITTPAERPLLTNVNFELEHNQSLLLIGKSGLGKSTLLRTLAGIWPFYSGDMQLVSAETSLLPQKPYLPTGSLRECLSYPKVAQVSDNLYIEALAKVGLNQLLDKLDASQEWTRSLSGGEQQKLALARVLLQQPALLIMDEATNQLDEPTALALMQMLMVDLPKAQIIMVSHQTHLQPLFDRCLDLGEFESEVVDTDIVESEKQVDLKLKSELIKPVEFKPCDV